MEVKVSTHFRKACSLLSPLFRRTKIPVWAGMEGTASRMNSHYTAQSSQQSAAFELPCPSIAALRWGKIPRFRPATQQRTLVCQASATTMQPDKAQEYNVNMSKCDAGQQL